MSTRAGACRVSVQAEVLMSHLAGPTSLRAFSVSDRPGDGMVPQIVTLSPANQRFPSKQDKPILTSYPETCRSAGCSQASYHAEVTLLMLGS